MDKWEYVEIIIMSKVEVYRMSGAKPSKETYNYFLEALNKLGAEGWELVNDVSVATTTYGHRAYMKRKIS